MVRERIAMEELERVCEEKGIEIIKVVNLGEQWIYHHKFKIIMLDTASEPYHIKLLHDFLFTY